MPDNQYQELLDETANIPDSARKIVWGTMAWGGQWCTSPGYAYVHESIAGEFVAEARSSLRALYGSDPKTNPDYSRVINARNKGTVEDMAGASGPLFSLFPPENASGNYVKIVQQFRIRVHLDQNPQHDLRPGMSVEATVRVR